MGRKWILFFALLGTVVALDVATKAWAIENLSHGGPTELGGGLLPLTLHFNTGGLWGIGRGGLSRWFFAVATALALFVLGQIYRGTNRSYAVRMIAIPMIAGGAIGNLIDRLRWDRGVVDFIGPFDLGFTIFPIFNVADMAISCCTVLLVLSLWRHPEEPEEATFHAEELENDETQPSESP